MLVIVSLVFVIQLVESVENKNSASTDFFQAGQQENDVDADKTFCPTNPHKMPFFGFKCKTNEDCVVPGEVCCKENNFKICRRGIPKRYRDNLDIQIKKSAKQYRTNTIHEGVRYCCDQRDCFMPLAKIQKCLHSQAHTCLSGPYEPSTRRSCPSREAFIEMLPIQNCTDDSDCGLWRICCPDGEHSYCRRAVPQLDLIFSSEIVKTFNSMMSYLQCTSPPPPLLDFFAKPCKNVLDCFPNLCCQEQGRKVCRPSRRSIFPFLAILT